MREGLGDMFCELTFSLFGSYNVGILAYMLEMNKPYGEP